MTNKKDRKWHAEIFYEEEEGLTANLPFVTVPDDKDMPDMFFIQEVRETGEFEPGLDGEDVPIVDIMLHQYANMMYLQEGLSEEVFDLVRQAIGLEPRKIAAAAGAKITQKIRETLEN